MTHYDATDDYVQQYYSLISDPLHTSTPNGALQSPTNPRENLYRLEGATTLIMNTNTHRVSAVLDAEPTLRNGQTRAYVYEYNSAGAIIGMTSIDISASSGNFETASVVSSRMDISNSSSENEMAGHITGAVLNVQPENLHDLTQTKLRQKTPSGLDRKESHFKDGGVSMFSVTSHLGVNSASLASDCHPHADDWKRRYVHQEGVTTTGFTTPGVNLTASGTAGTAISAATALAATGAADKIWDTDKFTTSPFTQATFGLSVQYQGELLGSTTSSSPERFQFGCAAVDQAGTILEAQYITTVVQSITANEVIHVDLEFEFTKLPRPIARTFIWLAEASVTNVQLPLSTAGQASGRQQVKMSGYQNTADIPGRDITIAVAEGVNSGAAITITCAVVVSAIAAADRTFISGGPGKNAVNDGMIVNYLRSVVKNVPRANLIEEIGVLNDVIYGIQARSDHSDALHAWSFSKIADAFNSAAETVRAGVRSADKVMMKVVPVMKGAGAAAMTMGGVPMVGKYLQVGGQVMSRGADLATKVHQVTQYADSVDRMRDTRTHKLLSDYA